MNNNGTIHIPHTPFPEWVEPLHDNMVKVIEITMPYLINTTEITAAVRYIDLGKSFGVNSANAIITFHMVKYDASLCNALRNADLSLNIVVSDTMLGASGVQWLYEHTKFNVSLMLSQIVRWDIYGSFDEFVFEDDEATNHG